LKKILKSQNGMAIISFPSSKISWLPVKIGYILDREGYKVAYVVKPITKTFNKATFRIISASKKRLAIGVCHKNVIKKRKFGFLYHTIGHGIYGISCQGGMWSHNES